MSEVAVHHRDGNTWARREDAAGRKQGADEECCGAAKNPRKDQVKLGAEQHRHWGQGCEH